MIEIVEQSIGRLFFSLPHRRSYFTFSIEGRLKVNFSDTDNLEVVRSFFSDATVSKELALSPLVSRSIASHVDAYIEKCSAALAPADRKQAVEDLEHQLGKILTSSQEARLSQLQFRGTAEATPTGLGSRTDPLQRNCQWLVSMEWLESPCLSIHSTIEDKYEAFDTDPALLSSRIFGTYINNLAVVNFLSRKRKKVLEHGFL